MLPISLELAELEKQYLQEKVIHRRSSKQDPPETHLTSVGTVKETHGKITSVQRSSTETPKDTKIDETKGEAILIK
jgi:hypothetical protein